MKTKMNKPLRKILICFAVILTGITGYLLFIQAKYPGMIDKKITQYTCMNKPDIKYNVLLKPNILYDVPSLGEDNVYFTELVDRIQASYTYQFSGDKPAEIKGDYSITAILEAYTEEKEKVISLWRKEIPVLPRTEIAGKDMININKELPIKLVEYNELAKKINDAVKIVADTKLSVIMNINIKAETEKGTVESKLAPMLLIPLGGNTFTISKAEIEQKPGVIEQTIKEQLPVDRNRVIIFSTVSGLFLLALVFLVFFTSAAAAADPLDRHLKKIFKNHGSRLVALNGEISADYKKFGKVVSMNDLVRIADELGKPIMYEKGSDKKQMTQFYVFDTDWLYIFDLKEALDMPKDNPGIVIGNAEAGIDA